MRISCISKNSLLSLTVIYFGSVLENSSEFAPENQRLSPVFTGDLVPSHSLAYLVNTYAEDNKQRISPCIPSRNPSRRTYILKNKNGGRTSTSYRENFFLASMRSSAASEV